MAKRMNLRNAVPGALGAALLLLASMGSARAAPKAACELLTLQQVGAALGAPVRIDRSASGADPNGGDNCVWASADGRNVMTRIIAVKDRNFVQFTFLSEISNAYSNGPKPEPLAGVGDEARYRAYTGNLAGGVIVARKGNVILVFEGPVARARLSELAKAVAAGL